ncbi:MAG: carbohydrate ABC transporter permease [Christensenellales bacterium]|jgi:multiple sugar transport system permease protein
MKRKNRMNKLLIIFLFVSLAIVLIPIFWAIVIAFDRSVTTEIPNPPRFWPLTLSLFNFKYAFTALPLLRYFLNTLFVTISNTSISVFFAMTCGYAFSKGNFMFKKTLFLVMIAVMMIPFEARMIPLFMQFKNWKMLNTYWPLILGGFAYSYGMFLAKQSIDEIPESLRESAFIDGANEWRVFFQIILPLSKPIIATLFILQSIVNWNNFLWPLIVIGKRDMQLLAVGISLFNTSDAARYVGPVMAVAIMAALPILIVFFIFQRQIVESMAFVGIKQ